MTTVLGERKKLMTASAAVVLLCSSVSFSADRAPEDIAAIEALCRSFATHWNARDAKALTSLFTHDGDHITSRGIRISGSTDLHKAFSAAFQKPEYKDSKTTIVDIRTKLLAPHYALADFAWESKGLRDSDGKELPPRQGASAAMLIKREGRWVIIALRSMRPHKE